MSQSDSDIPPSIMVLLVNLGTPDAPTPHAVSRYLRQFLLDPRVIEIPRLIWVVILNLLVIPGRSKRVARAYASIWDGDSPMRKILFAQAAALSQHMSVLGRNTVEVLPAMTYGNPAITAALSDGQRRGIKHVVVLPLFPQYSATSTGAVFDVVSRWIPTQRNLPSLILMKDYADHPLYIAALADCVHRYQSVHGIPEKLLMSFHGIPQPYADRGDPYAERCHTTAQLLAQALGLTNEQWAISFQSRFGRQEWVKPYTNSVLSDWAQSGVTSVQVISPAFSADCLETLEELAIENREVFLQAGGQRYEYIPALNVDDLHIEMMASLVSPMLDGLATSAQR